MSEPAGPGRQMSAPEALMWALDEDAALHSSFMGITILDSAPDHERFRRRMAEAVASVAAMRQRVVPAANPLATPRLEPDPDFDLDFHVRRLALPAPGSRRQLLDLAALLYADPFDRHRPLWQFTLVEGLEGGRAALLAKMHHVMSDGVGAVRVSVAFLDLSEDGDIARPPARSDDTPDAAPTEAPGGVRGWFDAAAGSLGPLLAGNVDLTRRALTSVVRSPGEGISTAIATARSAGRQLGIVDPARSALWSKRSHVHRFDTLTLDLQAMRRAARHFGGTVNDAFLTVMAGAAGDYHQSLGADVEDLRITMPISVRHDHAVGGNAWVPTRFLVPTGSMTTADRFGEVVRRVATVKNERTLGLADTFAGAVRYLPSPILLRLARQQINTVDFACSNVRGAPFDLWIAGAKVLANHPLGPTAGVALNATVLSYRDSLDLGLNSDTGAVADPELLVSCVEAAMADLIRGASRSRRSPAS